MRFRIITPLSHFGSYEWQQLMTPAMVRTPAAVLQSPT
jgi:hypothetical protein